MEKNRTSGLRRFAKVRCIVIAHGTDTRAYAVAMVSFMMQSPGKPIIFTSSQKSIGFERSDANENLLQAFEAVSSGSQGVFFAFVGKIIHGCHAYKIHSRQPDAFVSRNYPYIIAENQPEYQKKTTEFISFVFGEGFSAKAGSRHMWRCYRSIKEPLINTRFESQS